jgi:acyl-CoA thioester hydrolase
MKKYQFELEFKVRDYECDLQGIVNNSVYQNYLEHTRHEFLNTIGVDFADMFKKGVVAVVARVDIQYKTSLKSGDRFISKLNVEQQGVRYLFYQDIYRIPDNVLCIKSTITTVTIINGKIKISKELSDAISRL